MQTSESFRLSAILSFSGGLQDAYTYNVRGNVFANAQTGNVVLMSQNFMMRNRDRASLIKALHFFGIILFFAIGAGVGGVLSNVLYTKTIWVSPLMLTAVAVMMIRENR